MPITELLDVLKDNGGPLSSDEIARILDQGTVSINRILDGLWRREEVEKIMIPSNDDWHKYKIVWRIK